MFHQQREAPARERAPFCRAIRPHEGSSVMWVAELRLHVMDLHATRLWLLEHAASVAMLVESYRLAVSLY